MADATRPARLVPDEALDALRRILAEEERHEGPPVAPRVVRAMTEVLEAVGDAPRFLVAALETSNYQESDRFLVVDTGLLRFRPSDGSPPVVGVIAEAADAPSARRIVHALEATHDLPTPAVPSADEEPF